MYFSNAKNYYKLCHSTTNWVGGSLDVIFQKIFVFSQQQQQKKFLLKKKKKNFYSLGLYSPSEGILKKKKKNFFTRWGCAASAKEFHNFDSSNQPPCISKQRCNAILSDLTLWARHFVQL
jgi:hypothetical protein